MKVPASGHFVANVMVLQMPPLGYSDIYIYPFVFYLSILGVKKFQRIGILYFRKIKHITQGTEKAWVNRYPASAEVLAYLSETATRISYRLQALPVIFSTVRSMPVIKLLVFLEIRLNLIENQPIRWTGVYGLGGCVNEHKAYRTVGIEYLFNGE